MNRVCAFSFLCCCPCCSLQAILDLIAWSNFITFCSKSSDIQGRRQRGGAMVPGPPFEICAPHFMFDPQLLHTSNILFLKCGPPLWLLPPLMRNAGDGPGDIAIAFGRKSLPTNTTLTEAKSEGKNKNKKIRNSKLSITPKRMSARKHSCFYEGENLWSKAKTWR